MRTFEEAMANGGVYAAEYEDFRNTFPAAECPREAAEALARKYDLPDGAVVLVWQILPESGHGITYMEPLHRVVVWKDDQTYQTYLAQTLRVGENASDVVREAGARAR
jgi:hypothetical protein